MVVGVGDGSVGSPADDVFRSLMPFVAERSGADWAARWTLIVAEVDRRSAVMGLSSAVASVRDDLAAERL